MQRRFQRRSRSPYGEQLSRASHAEWRESVVDLTNSDDEVHNVWSSESERVFRRTFPRLNPPSFSNRSHVIPPIMPQHHIPQSERARINDPNVFCESLPGSRAAEFCTPRTAVTTVRSTLTSSSRTRNADPVAAARWAVEIDAEVRRTRRSMEERRVFPIAPSWSTSNRTDHGTAPYVQTTRRHVTQPEPVSRPVPSQAQASSPRQRDRRSDARELTERQSLLRLEQQHLQNVERLRHVQRELRMIHAELGAIRMPSDRERSRDRNNRDRRRFNRVRDSSTDSDPSTSTPSPPNSPSARSEDEETRRARIFHNFTRTPPSTPHVPSTPAFAPHLPITPPMSPASAFAPSPLITQPLSMSMLSLPIGSRPTDGLSGYPSSPETLLAGPVTPPMLGSIFDSPTNVSQTLQARSASEPSTPSFSSRNGAVTPSASQSSGLPFSAQNPGSASPMLTFFPQNPRTTSPISFSGEGPMQTPSTHSPQPMSASPTSFSRHDPVTPSDYSPHSISASPTPLPSFFEVPLSPTRWNEGSSSDVRASSSASASRSWLIGEAASSGSARPHQPFVRSEPDIPCYFHVRTACSSLRITVSWCSRCFEQFQSGVVVVGLKRKTRSPEWMHISCFMDFAVGSFSDSTLLVRSREYLEGQTGNAQTLAVFHRFVSAADRDRLLQCFNLIGTSANLEAWIWQGFGRAASTRSSQHQPSAHSRPSGASDAQSSDLGARMTRNAIFSPLTPGTLDDDFHENAILNDYRWVFDPQITRTFVRRGDMLVELERGHGRQRQPEQNAKVQRIIDSVPVTTSDFDGECCICMEQIVRGKTTIRRLPCKHAYHNACIDEWMRRKTVCPLDNLEIEV